MFGDVRLCSILVFILALCITYFTNADSVTWVQNFPGNIGRYRREAVNCGTEKFQCKSGQCINEEESCDGKPQCDDNSDETEEKCSKNCCPPFTYTCKYGGCVAKNARCNGTQECFDGSDEAGCPVTAIPSTVTVKPTFPNGSCFIPNNPQYGEFSINDKASGFYKPGSYVPTFSILTLNCKERFKIIPPQSNPYSFCANGQWSPPPGTCARSCRSIHSTISTKVECMYNGRPLDSCENPVEGTIARLLCEPFYEEPGLSKNPIRVCTDGSWDFHIPECLPMCGVKLPVAVNNVGQHIAKLYYPWQVGIYTADKNYVCGGSILSQRVILSAAHCFTNNDDGRLKPKENYLIGAGKYYRTYDDYRDENAQYSKIDAIHIPERYKGRITNFEADIAVVILETKLNLSPAVQPVCVDWGTNFEYQQLSENNFGTVTGWGYTVEGDKLSEELRKLEVPYISFAQCYEQLPKTFRKYLTYDKICAGYLNNGTAVCEGNTSGGLTFEHLDDRYYIRGVKSTSPASEQEFCDFNQYGTYTLVSKHIDFIKTLEIQNRS